MPNAPLTIKEVVAREEILATRCLFEEYATWLGVDLSFQSFDEELATLPEPYVRPTGFILLAERKRVAVGCVALRKIGERIGEVKRLYVIPKYRGYGVGRRLMQYVIGEARNIGYSSLRLDTLPQMETARALYASLGFKQIAAYYYNPIEGAEFMELALV